MTEILSALDLLPAPAVLVDERLRISGANEAARLLLPSISASSSLLDQAAVEDGDKLRNLVILCLDSPRSAAGLDLKLGSAAAERKWRNLQAKPVPGFQGFFVVTILDIHAAKTTQIETRHWEERWNAALVGSDLGVWDHDIRRGIYFYSGKWKEIRGLQRDSDVEADYETWIGAVHPDDRDRVRSYIEKQAAGDLSVTSCEYRERRADGEYVWIECRGACFETFSDGTAARIIGTDLDITARKEAEGQIERLKQRFELALEATRIGVFEADIADQTVQFDDTLLEIFGLPPGSNIMGGDDWLHIIHPDDHVAATQRIDDGTASGTDFSNDFRIIRPSDGALRHIRARAARFVDGNGRQKIIGANWDVTDDISVRDELERAKVLAETRNTELETIRTRLEFNALHDDLTGLPNRRYLDETLARRSGTAGLAILHIDLDRFKQINDTLGHRAGDFMLGHTSAVLRSTAGPDDFVARIGGDEFVIVSPFEGNLCRLQAMATRIIDQLRAPVHVDKTPCRVGASVGIAFDARSDCDATQLLQNADMALYRAKSNGKNRYEFFTIELQDQIVVKKRVSDEILASLERGEFIPYFQPQFDARSLDLAGLETLARWAHPLEGILPPASFLAIAEELDVVSAIDAMVMEKALDHMKALGASAPKISFNISVRRLSDPELMTKLDRLPIPPEKISFELLETIFLDESEGDLAANIEALRSRGFGLEIDDFGSGHASVIGLLKVKPHTLKVDRALIKPIVENREQRQLVEAIIGIGHSLGMKVTAEGVETSAHIDLLRDMNCDLLQGFALAKPMSYTDLRGFIARQDWRR
ncbi:bifunctional diguanylate cyclase/phosphodiesterase [Rhizobium sp. TRM95796]|uniref:bifunctional diguanylate cyclase/phosphodiesterase n=1 Tax=Rhizobium sp. TRM95796 TaxID=2979862 RepID=UPI0021E73426|nr:bifunctional diguanylate cyclase/phosphodiesterase [Rhizobium sp. TRM95796]MCV3766780.1 EAL domain-containing protein [Rhizobium sp. TRM95796]